MKLTKEEAKKLIEDARGKTESDGWIDHSICVGNSAGIIAEALNQKGYELDVDKAITLGYIHDIGKMVGSFHEHVMNGYEYMKKQGYDEDYYNICLTHSYLNNDVQQVVFLGKFLSGQNLLKIITIRCTKKSLICVI